MYSVVGNTHTVDDTIIDTTLKCCTFYCVQYHINDGTEHILDATCYSLQKVVSNTEDVSADDHGVHEAQVGGS